MRIFLLDKNGYQLIIRVILDLFKGYPFFFIMEEYIKYFETQEEYDEYLAGDEVMRPNVSYCEDVKDVHYNPYVREYDKEYFTTVALEDGTITFTPISSNAISYSTDNGNTWTEGNSVNVVNGDSVIWKGTMTPLEYEGIGSFTSTCNFDVQGNIMSLLFDDYFKNQLSLEGKNYCFPGLFYGLTKIINAENLSLPATTLSRSCYNCMFMDCTSLTTAPELPATTLAEYCYVNMFNGCSSLNYIKAMFTTTPSTTYTQNWVSGVAASGTFVKNSAAQWDVSGVNGIPTGWTVETATV